MIAFDTNVLIRFLVRDDERQARRAAVLIERAIGEGQGVFVSDVVLAETTWVLDRAYGFKRNEIATALRGLVSARDVGFADRDLIARALRGFEGGRSGFADYLIREQARSAGCDTVHTFDRKLLREDGFDKV